VKAVFVAALVLAFAACSDPYRHEYAIEKPDQHQLAGRYTPTAESRARVASKLQLNVSARCEILLRNDGRVVAHALPNCWFAEGGGDCEPGNVDFDGRWVILRDEGDRYYIKFYTDHINQRAEEFMFTALLRHHAPPYLLHFPLSEPEVGDALVLARVTTDTSAPASQAARRGDSSR